MLWLSFLEQFDVWIVVHTYASTHTLLRHIFLIFFYSSLLHLIVRMACKSKLSICFDTGVADNALCYHRIFVQTNYLIKRLKADTPEKLFSPRSCAVFLELYYSILFSNNLIFIWWHTEHQAWRLTVMYHFLYFHAHLCINQFVSCNYYWRLLSNQLMYNWSSKYPRHQWQMYTT